MSERQVQHRGRRNVRLGLRRARFVAAATLALAAMPGWPGEPVRAATTRYWDGNGATAGAGGTTPTGTWGSSAFWSTSSGGTAATGAWVDGDAAVFSAGTDATGTYSVSVSGLRVISGLTFEEGTITLDDASGALSFSGVTSFTVQPATLATINTVPVGTGSMIKAGTGTLVLGNQGGWSGGTSVNAGTLRLQTPYSLGSTGGVTLGGGTLVHDLIGAMYAGRTVTMNVPSTMSITPAKQLNFQGALSGGGNALTVNGGGVFYMDGATVNNVPSISVTGNTLFGTTTNNGLGGATTTINVADGSSVQGYGELTVPSPLVLNGTTTGSGALSWGTGTGGEWGGPVTLNADSGVGGANFFAITGNVSGAGGLVKLGAQRVRLQGSNTYAGATTINAGDLEAFGGSGIPDTSPVTLANTAGALLEINPFLAASETIGGLAGGGAAGGNVQITSAGRTLIVAQDATTTYSGVISGAGALVKSGAGTLVLTRANTYSGGTTITDSAITVEHPSALGSGNITLANAALSYNLTDYFMHSGQTVTMTSFAGLEVSSGNQLNFAGTLNGGGNSLGVGGGGTLYLGQPGNSVTNIGNISVIGFGTSLGSDTNAAGWGGTAGVPGSGPHVEVDPGNSLQIYNNVTMPNPITVYGGLALFKAGGTAGGGFSGPISLLGVNIGIGGDYDFTISGNMSLGGSIDKVGAGTVRLSGTNTYTGGTKISGGTLQLAASTAMPSTGAITLSGGTLSHDFNSVANLYPGRTITLTADSSLAVTPGKSVTIAGSVAGGTKTLTIAGGGTLYLGVSGGGAVSNVAGISVSGNSVLGTSLGNGLGGTSATPGSGPTITVANGSRFEVSNGSSVPNPIVLNGGVTGDGALKANGGNFTGPITLNATSGITALNDAAIFGNITGTGGFTKLGDALMGLSGTNTYAGPTTINAGTLNVVNDNAIPNGSVVTLANTLGATLRIAGAETIGGLAGGGATGGNVEIFLGTLSVNQASAGTFAGQITGAGSFTKNGAGTLTIVSSNNTYSGGTTLFNGGTLRVTGNGALGTGAITMRGGSVFLDNANQTITNLNFGGGVTATGSIIGNGTLTMSGDLNFNGNATLTTAPGFVDTPLALPAGNHSLTSNANKSSGEYDVLLRGLISGAGGLTKTGGSVSSVAITSAGNTYSGETTINAGRLYLGVANALPANGAVTVNNGGTLSLNPSVPQTGIVTGNYNQSIGSLAGTTGGVVELGSATLTVGNNNASTTFGGNVTGTGAVVKAGTGTLTLNGINSYTGSTTVNAGKLAVAGNLVSTSAVTVAGSGSTLELSTGGGSNRVIKTGSVTLTGGGKLDLKDNKLILTAGSAGTASGGAYNGVTGLIQAARNSGAWDGVGLTTSMPAAVSGLTSLGIATAAQTGDTTFGGVSVAGSNVLVMYTYAGDANLDGFISGDDYSAIDFNIAVANSSGWYNGDFNYDGIISGDDYSAIDFNIVAQGTPFPTGSSTGFMSVVAVPEPHGMAAIAAGLVALARRRRRHTFALPAAATKVEWKTVG